MPGVLMLEALVEAGAWLLRVTDDFTRSVIVLREARNVKYGTFIEPGRQLVVSVDMQERDGSLATLKGKGEVDGQPAVSARVMLASYNLTDRNPSLKSTDERLVRHWRGLYGLLRLSPAAGLT